jgi:hypothetical protein
VISPDCTGLFIVTRERISDQDSHVVKNGEIFDNDLLDWILSCINSVDSAVPESVVQPAITLPSDH